jgi:hypothetical protein
MPSPVSIRDSSILDLVHMYLYSGATLITPAERSMRLAWYSCMKSQQTSETLLIVCLTGIGPKQLVVLSI